MYDLIIIFQLCSVGLSFMEVRGQKNLVVDNFGIFGFAILLVKLESNQSVLSISEAKIKNV